MASIADSRKLNFSNIGNASVLLAALSGFALIASAMSKPEAMHAYMLGFICFAAMVLGCLGLTLLHHICKGSWSLSILRILEAGGGPTAILTLAASWAFLFFKGKDVFYEHAFHPEKPWPHFFKRMYYTEPWYIGRMIAFFLIWFVLAYALQKSSRRQDETGSKSEEQFRANLGTVGMILFILTSTFAITDWVMAMDPHWTSSIYGLWFVVTGGLLALAFATLMVCLNRGKAPYSEVISPSLTKDLGNMCFALTMLWAYFTLSQWLIIWSGNLPEFTSYYVVRNFKNPQFLILGGANVIIGFFFCWFGFLTPKVKANPKALAFFCAIAILVRFGDIYYNVVPFMRTTFSVYDLLGLGFFATLWLAIFGLGARDKMLVPVYDNRLREGNHAH